MKPLRIAAAEVLLNVVQDGHSLSRALPPALAAVLPEERPRLQELCYGTCRWWFRLRAELTTRMKSPLRGTDRIIDSLLMLALYQLRYGHTADHAVINEAVETCRQLGKPNLAGLVNAVLRECQRSGEPASEQPETLQAHPLWLVEKLKHNWPGHWEAILAANNQHPPMTLRVNRQRISREDMLQQLIDADIDAEACQLAPWGIRLLQPMPVSGLPGFADGMISVQDEAAQLCTLLLDLQPGQRVLDACAAPGGKTCAIAEAEPALACLLALDQDAGRLERVHENLDRLCLAAEVRCADAAQPASWWDGQRFDRILLDAPCSGTGVIRRHPDIKLLRRETDITPLAGLQLNLLRELWALLAPGGRLVYATCSVFPQENDRIIARFLREQADARPAMPDVEWGLSATAGRQLLPEAGHDGFFYACLDKIAQPAEPEAGSS